MKIGTILCWIGMLLGAFGNPHHDRHGLRIFLLGWGIAIVGVGINTLFD